MSVRHLIALRWRALTRTIGRSAGSVLVLVPMVGGTAVLLLQRLLADLAQRGVPQSVLLAGVWGVGLILALCLARARAAEGVDLVACLPLGAGVLALDRYLSALFRVVPIALLMALVIPVLGGGGAQWGALASGLVAMPLLGLIPNGRGRLRLRWWRRCTAGLAGLPGGILRAPLGPLVWRDMVMVWRGFSPYQGGYWLLSLAAGSMALLQAIAERPRLSLLGVALSAWALSAMVSLLFAHQRPTLWMVVDEGVSAAQIWRVKAVVACLLGLLPGGLIALVWAGSDPLVAVTACLVGPVVGLCVGGVLLEGERRPALHGVISLIFAVGMATLVIWHPLWSLAVPLVLSYLEQVGEPRLRRFIEDAARAA